MATRHLNNIIIICVLAAGCAFLPERQVSAVEPSSDMMITETGSTISLDLRGIDITEFLKVLSKKLNINIIPSKSVSGRVTLFLNNITYQNALDVVILSQGLAYEKKDNNIIMVMTDAEYEALFGQKFNEKRTISTLKLMYASPMTALKVLDNLKSSVGTIIINEKTGALILIDTPEKLKLMKEAVKDFDRPSVTEIFELQYAKAADIKDKVAAIATEGASEVLIDERTNSLIVRDLYGNMSRVRQTITMLDQETKQVFIEAEIMEISLRDRFQGGVEWEKVFADSFTHMALSTVFQSALGAGLVGTFFSPEEGMTLKVLETIGNTKTLSSPRIAVTNNEEATILVGTREAYVTGTTSQSGDSTITSDTVEFVDVGVKLKVVPTINRDGYITMKIKPEISTVSRTLTTGAADAPRSQIPIVQTSEAETTVKVKDGMTIFIAGLRQNQARHSTDGLPFLARVPYLNWFFSTQDKNDLQTEIIIFLTPHIITGGEARKWDSDQMRKYPAFIRPENKGYNSIEPEFKIQNLKMPREKGN